jgi:hypothetical protein
MIDADKIIEELIERQCDNMACGTQMREFLRDDEGNEPLLREMLRLNLEQFACSLSTTLKDLQEKAEALDNLLTFFDVTKYPDSLYAGCGFNLNNNSLHPYLRKRLGKEG